MAALFVAMTVLAATPSVSVLLVSARSVSAGFRQGVLVTLGIVAADALFILAAIFGLAALAEALGERFAWVRYIGAAYVIALGLALARSARPTAPDARGQAPSFLAGLLVTLADQKALLFYFAFFPAFVDLAALTPADVAAVLLIATLAVGGAKLVYAYAADRAGRVAGERASHVLRLIAAGVMIAAGVWIAVRT